MNRTAAAILLTVSVIAIALGCGSSDSTSDFTPGPTAGGSVFPATSAVNPPSSTPEERDPAPVRPAPVTTGDTIALADSPIVGAWRRRPDGFVSVGCAVGDERLPTPPARFFSTGWCLAPGAETVENPFEYAAFVILEGGNFEVTDPGGNTCAGELVEQHVTERGIQVDAAGIGCGGYPDDDVSFQFIPLGARRATFDGVEFVLVD